MAEIKAMEKKIKNLEAANDILKKPWVSSQIAKRSSCTRDYSMIWLHKTNEKSKHSVRTMCSVLDVSEAGYYKWLKRQAMPYKHDELLAKILQIHADNPDYGANIIFLHL